MQESLSQELPLLYHSEAEQSVLCACILDNRRLDEVAALIGPSAFFRDSYGRLFAAMVELREKGLPVDVASIFDHLGRVEYEAIGGDRMMEEIVVRVPHGANAAYYASIVKDKQAIRCLVDASAETERDVRSCEWTSSELLARAEQRIFAILEREAVGETIDAKQLIDETIAQVERLQNGEVLGVETGFSDLDRALRGLPRGGLTILGARPSQGKTALGLNIAANVAMAGEPVLFVSLEMTRQELGGRLLSYLSELSTDRILRCWDSSDQDRKAVSAAYTKIAQLPLKTDDTPARTISQIAANARRVKHRGGLALIVVDYLGLVDGQKQKGESRQEEVARISRRLKAMARELDVAVLALHQLNRMAENREGNRPRLSDLRESGQIEQDADAVLLLHRPETYKKGDRIGEADLILAKNRNGPTGAIRLTFRKELTTFASFGGADSDAPY